MSLARKSIFLKPIKLFFSLVDSKDKPSSFQHNWEADILLTDVHLRSMEFEYFERNGTTLYLNHSDEYYYYYNFENYYGNSAIETFGLSPITKGILVLLYAVIIITSFLGNVFICMSYKKEVIQRTNTNLFILVVAINDIIQILFEPFLVISNIIFYSWPYPSFTCPLVVNVQFITVYFKAFILVAMSCEKYIAVSMPTRRCHKRRVAYIMTFFLFVAAILVALPTALYTRVSFKILAIKGHGLCLEMWHESSQKYIYSIVTMILQYFLPIIVMGVSYTHIIVILQKHRMPGEPMQERDRRLMKSKKKVNDCLLCNTSSLNRSDFPSKIKISYFEGTL